MRTSPSSRNGTMRAIVSSTTPAGTISQSARGFCSLPMRSCRLSAPVAFSATNDCTAFGDMSKTTHWCPPLMSRRAMLAPILPSPTIPSCILLFLSRAQAVHGGGDAAGTAKDRRSGHQYAGSRFDAPLAGFGVDAPIHLQVALGFEAIDHLSDAADLGQSGMDKMLVPETRIDRHHEHLVHVRQNFFEHFRGSCRIDGDARAFAERADALH